MEGGHPLTDALGCLLIVVLIVCVLYIASAAGIAGN